MEVLLLRKIGTTSWLLLLLSIIVGIWLCVSPRTSISKDSNWIPYKIRQQYTDYSLPNGSLPYRQYYGGNYSYGYSAITVRASNNSDVVVIIKNNNANGSVAAHAYICKGCSYSFDLPNGTYQTFFYFGKDWYPEKNMNGGIKGGFINNEAFSKDNPRDLYDQELTYSLVRQQNGNFQTKKSNSSEAF